MDEHTNDKMHEHIQDVTQGGTCSDCCGATVYYEDICGDCKEHCTPVYDDIECLKCSGGICAIDYDLGNCIECGEKYPEPVKSAW